MKIKITQGEKEEIFLSEPRQEDGPTIWENIILQVTCEGVYRVHLFPLLQSGIVGDREHKIQEGE